MDEGTGGDLSSQAARAGGPAGVGQLSAGLWLTENILSSVAHASDLETAAVCKKKASAAASEHRALYPRGKRVRDGQSLASPVIPHLLVPLPPKPGVTKPKDPPGDLRQVLQAVGASVSLEDSPPWTETPRIT